MSENEIKPVDGVIPTRKFDGQLWIPADVAIELRSKDRAAIDRLTAERDAAVDAAELMESQLHELAAERDEAQRKLSVAVANGNALVADAERLEWVVSARNMRVQGSGDSWSVLDCSNGLTFAVRNAPTMRAAIDAARAEGWV